MLTELFDRKEKKVEYIELIYDLIFVYMIGRNNSLLHHGTGGFVEGKAILAYVLCTLAVIQIWNFTTFYINMFGRNGVRDHVFLFINMYLMYFIGQATRLDWFAYQTQYHIAWGLILVNIGVQYAMELRNHRADLWNRDIIKRMMFALFTEAAIVFAAALPFPHLVSVLSGTAIATGIVLTALGRKKSPGGAIDFAHLTERAMLYVVFTFGEMIIVVASYFTGDGSWSWNVIYFSLMAFLIVVGLFLSYGFVYDRLIDREGSFDGMGYMILHIFIIFALNNITASLEFMREEEMALLPKVLFLIGSLIAYFVFLFALQPYAKCRCRPTVPLMAELLLLTVAFVAAMLLFKNNMIVNILVSVIFVFGVFLVLWLTYRKDKTEEEKARAN